MTRRVIAIAALMACASACGAERVPRPSAPAPTIENPADALPGDLDLVIRIDLARMRDALGAASIDAVAKRAPEAADDDGRLIDAALKRTDTAWIGLRPASRVALLDNVIVLRGHFAGLDPRELGKWGPPADLGAGWRLYERPAGATRAGAARVYARGDELMVLVSSAEIDSAERSIERGERESHPDPPAKGTISLAARLQSLAELLADRSAAAARLLREGRMLEASADLGSTGLQAELAIEMDDPATARRTADAAGLLARGVADQGGVAGRIAASLRIEAVGSSVVVKLALDPAALESLRKCAADESACS